MKTKTMTTLATCIVAASILFTSCKKGDNGPAGTNGTNGIVPAMADGFIKGQIIGTRQNGTQINEAFSYQNFWSGHAGTLDSTSALSYTFMMQRAVDIFGTNSANISITVTSPTATTGVLSLNSFMFTKMLGTNKEFDFNKSGTVTAPATTLSYDKNTGLFSGNFNITLTGAQNSSGNPATITGSFQATITQLYYFTQHAALPNANLKN